MNKEDRDLFSKIDDRLDTIDKGQNRILSFIETDEKTGRKGMYVQVSENTQDIEEIKTDKKVMLGKVAVATLILGTLGGILTRIFFK